MALSFWNRISPNSWSPVSQQSLFSEGETWRVRSMFRPTSYRFVWYIWYRVSRNPMVHPHIFPYWTCHKLDGGYTVRSTVYFQTQPLQRKWSHAQAIWVCLRIPGGDLQIWCNFDSMVILNRETWWKTIKNGGPLFSDKAIYTLHSSGRFIFSWSTELLVPSWSSVRLESIWSFLAAPCRVVAKQPLFRRNRRPVKQQILIWRSHLYLAGP